LISLEDEGIHGPGKDGRNRTTQRDMRKTFLSRRGEDVNEREAAVTNISVSRGRCLSVSHRPKKRNLLDIGRPGIGTESCAIHDSEWGRTGQREPPWRGRRRHPVRRGCRSHSKKEKKKNKRRRGERERGGRAEKGGPLL